MNSRLIPFVRVPRAQAIWPFVISGLALLSVTIVTAAAKKRPASIAPLPEAQDSRLISLKLTHERGFYEQPFELSCPSASGFQVWFTTDGSSPRPDKAQRWVGTLTLSNSTILRFAAFRESLQVSHVQTHTFLFPTQVARQTGEGFPLFWGMTNGIPVQATYTLDQQIINLPLYRDLVGPALKSIPSVSVVMDREDLFGSDRGIYSHPGESGLEWERPCSIELIYPNGRLGFQTECGLRIQGGWNRRPEESPKHALRLVFNRRYGPATLRFPLFANGSAREFETLILRAGCNNTWLHWSSEERQRGDYIRDQWMRDTLNAMGHPSAHGMFVHLYLNGLYWGLYDLSERPSAPFAASHFGGKAKDYDSRNGDHILQGSGAAWDDLMHKADAGAATLQTYEAIEARVDMPQFIDYMLLNLYGANADWDGSSNWYAARRRDPPGMFHFFVWDGERTLEGVDDNRIDYDAAESPPHLFQKLRQNTEFRMAFADRVEKHLFGAGSLAPGPAAQRFATLAHEIEQAIVMESARWGTYRRDIHPYKTGPFESYTRETHWRPEINRLLHEYFPRRSAVFLQQLRAAGIYPKIDPPVRTQTSHGTSLRAPAGSICFTRDGSDPRLRYGAISPSASVSQEEVVVFPGIKARALRENPHGMEWSSLIEIDSTGPEASESAP